MDFSFEAVNRMSPGELEELLTRLKKDDKYPHLAALIAYVLTSLYYYKGDLETARGFYNDLLQFLNTPPGYGWCVTLGAVTSIAGVSPPHYLHDTYVIERAFPRLAPAKKETPNAA